MSEKNVTKKTISNLLKKLFREKGISLERIVIFGSFAKGLQKEDSDIDIIVVSPDFRGKSIFERVKQTTGIDRELVRRTKKPFDIMYYSDEEWEAGNSLIINAAKEEGLVIYG
jgi:hypothetical protein